MLTCSAKQIFGPKCPRRFGTPYRLWTQEQQQRTTDDGDTVCNNNQQSTNWQNELKRNKRNAKSAIFIVNTQTRIVIDVVTPFSVNSYISFFTLISLSLSLFLSLSVACSFPRNTPRFLRVPSKPLKNESLHVATHNLMQ